MGGAGGSPDPRGEAAGLGAGCSTVGWKMEHLLASEGRCPADTEMCA